MKTFTANKYSYLILNEKKDCGYCPRPFLREHKGNEQIKCVSPIHGRSFIVGKNTDESYVVSKGNGLSYSNFNSLNTESFGKYTWGLLGKENAIRDFSIGEEINSLGIKTNRMEYVLELDKEIFVESTNEIIKPVLLQYNVETPYRISDYAFIPKDLFKKEIKKWEQINSIGYKKSHLIAANVLIKNLRILHDNNIMHNAIHVQNYTWALELLDFESSRSNKLPYKNIEYEKHVSMLMPAEVIQTYEVINYISWCLNEEVVFQEIDEIFFEYKFDLKQFKLL